jgi:hypothetical protein
MAELRKLNSVYKGAYIDETLLEQNGVMAYVQMAKEKVEERADEIT